jgi:hypothetical protein
LRRFNGNVFFKANFERGILYSITGSVEFIELERHPDQLKVETLKFRNNGSHFFFESLQSYRIPDPRSAASHDCSRFNLSGT